MKIITCNKGEELLITRSLEFKEWRLLDCEINNSSSLHSL